MSSFGFSNGNGINSLFASSSYSTGGMSFLTDYASIRNGSYYKLLKAYYGGNENVKSAMSNTATSKDSAKKLTAVEEDANNLKEAADALYKQGSKSVFKQVDIKKEDGTTEKGYDVSAIYKRVNKFVSAYNDVLSSAKSASSDSLDRSVKNLKNVTRSNASKLDDIGISVASDGTLSLDEDIFKEADMNKVKELFNGTGSYGYQVSARASMIDYAAQREASRANTYNKYGSYSNNYNYSYNSYI